MSVLKSLLSNRDPLVMPGVFDALSAVIAERAGFEGVFLSGSALAYSQLGQPDLGLLTLSEVADALTRIRDRVNFPILVDADSGFGNALNVARTVRVLERAGASAIQIEDQINHKRPGDLTGRPVISTAEMVGKIKAALDARHSGDTLISARSDSPFTLPFDEVMARAESYAEAGADIVFVEGLTDLNHLKRLADTFRGRKPLLHNLIDGGSSPVQSVDEAAVLGFGIVLFPGVAVQTATSAMERALTTLKTDGTTKTLRAAMHDSKSLNQLIGTPTVLAFAKRYDEESQK